MLTLWSDHWFLSIINYLKDWWDIILMFMYSKYINPGCNWWKGCGTVIHWIRIKTFCNTFGLMEFIELSLLFLGLSCSVPSVAMTHLVIQIFSPLHYAVELPALLHFSSTSPCWNNWSLHLKVFTVYCSTASVLNSFFPPFILVSCPL